MFDTLTKHARKKGTALLVSARPRINRKTLVLTAALCAVAVLCVLGVAVLAVGALVERAYREAYVERCPTGDKVVVLTFDDGPHPVLTPATLDILREKGVPAMFFVPGTAVPGLQGARHQEYDARHVLASHGLNHAVMRDLSWREQVVELRKGEVELARALGRPAPYVASAYVRSPRGEVHPYAVLGMWMDGRVHVGWSSAYDRRQHFGIEGQTERVRTYVESIRPGDIILMHDGNRNGEQMVQDLPLIIDGLVARGYRFATLGEYVDSKPRRRGFTQSLPRTVRALARIGEP